MAPTFIPGDQVYATASLPFFSKIKPKRGDVVFFEHIITSPLTVKRDNKKIIFVSRVIGIEGDKVKVSDGRLYLNDKLAVRIKIQERKSERGMLTLYRETLPGLTKSHEIYERADNLRLDNTPSFIVPEGHFFVMGDNRDNANDSRRSPHQGGMGFIPMDAIIARPRIIMWSGQD